MRLSSDIPIGNPSFELKQDQIDTAVDLVCCGVANARRSIEPEPKEVPTTARVAKSMRLLKRQLRLSNLQIQTEYELLNTETDDGSIQGRIDIVFQFSHQFGDEDAYLAIECKRVSPTLPKLNHRYVTEGIDRFATGQYAEGHYWGMMLGYVLHLPMTDLVDKISQRVSGTYGGHAKLHPYPAHPSSLSMRVGILAQGKIGHKIRLMHIFVDMTPV